MGGNCGVPVAIFIVFHFYLILADLSAVLIVDSALSPLMLLMFFLIISFCTWCCFFSCQGGLS